MPSTISKNSISSTWIVFVSLIPISLFFYTFFAYVTNIPFQDDYDALLEPVTKFTQLSPFSWKEFIHIIWVQDDERRIVVDRIAATLIYLVNGHLDLRIQMFIGLLSLLGFLFLFYTIIKEAQLPILLVVAASFLLFHIQYYEAIYWGMIPLQHIVVHFFALLSAYYLYKPKAGHLTLALVAAILAILSDVSGTFVLPTGLGLLLLQHRWKHAGIWVLVIGGMIGLYYYQLVVPAYRPKLSDNLQHPWLILYNFLSFSGLAADLNTVLPFKLRSGLIMATGLSFWCIVIYSAFLFIKPSFQHAKVAYPRWKITLWGGLIHFSITILAFAVGRAMEGTQAVLISRYKHMGFIWLILISILVFSQLRPTLRWARIWTILSVLVCFFSYFEYLAPLDYYYKERNTDMYGWEHNRALPSSPIYLSLQSAVDTITTQSIRAGVYDLPSDYFFEMPYQVSADLFTLETKQMGHALVFTNEQFIRSVHKNDGAYILLKNASQSHYIPTRQKRYSLKSFVSSLGKHYYANGFHGSFPVEYLQPNTQYQVWVVVIHGGVKVLHPTTYRLDALPNFAVRISQS